MKTYILTGNNLEIDFNENKNRLKLVGKNNLVKIVKNEGDVQIVGLHNRIKVKQNKGIVEVIGACESINIDASSVARLLDYDHVRIGPNVTQSDVKNYCKQRDVLNGYSYKSSRRKNCCSVI